MARFSYEIYTRGENQHHPGCKALMIEGIDCELTIDPSQFMPKALRETIEVHGAADPVLAQQICENYAEAILQRRIDGLRAGKVLAGHDVTRRAGAVGGGTASELKAARKQGKEERAVEVFLNRGRLKGMTKDDRKRRAEMLATRIDNDADWRERRAALIARCEAAIKECEDAVAKGDEKAAAALAVFRREYEGLTAPVIAATHGFQSAYVLYLTGGINLASDDIRIWPLMTNTDADTNRDAIATFADLTADEFDGANYSSGGLALDSQGVAADNANDRAEFDAADELVSALGAGTRSIQGVALGKFVTNTNASIPLHWLEFASNKTPDGSDFTFVFNAEGILQAADG